LLVRVYASSGIYGPAGENLSRAGTCTDVQ
jgi:hypothetical protein